MSITHKTLLTTYDMKTVKFDTLKHIYNEILNAYTWESGSKVVELSNDGNLHSVHGIYYFTKNSYLKLDVYSSDNYCITRTIVTPVGERSVGTVYDMFNVVYSVATTDKGVALNVWSGASGTDEKRDPHYYNLYIGEITLPNGILSKGCICMEDTGAYYVGTDMGISTESTFVSNIDNTRKTYLAPATDSTNGGIFKDIYMMFSSPIQYNKMKIVDTGTKYLCGKAMCLAD